MQMQEVSMLVPLFQLMYQVVQNEALYQAVIV